MKVKEITIYECCRGDILATDVINDRGVIVLAKDTAMNEYIKEQLIQLDVLSVRIYNPSRSFEDSGRCFTAFKNNYYNTVSQTRDVLQDLAAGRALDYQKVSSISSQIYQSLNENETIIRCLLEIKNANEYTYVHSVNTAFYSMLIAKWLKLSHCEINKVLQSGLLHDIGKIKIPNEILNKGGILTKEEYEVIKNHTTLGYGIVEEIDNIDFDIKRAILLHHERIDGTGYPLCLSQNDISLYARIVAVADVFDAMTSDRPYKKGVTPFEVFGMFQTVGMTMYDREILKVFLNHIAAHLVGSSVLLSNGKVGEIVYIPLQALTSPIIKVSSSSYVDFSHENTIKIRSML